MLVVLFAIYFGLLIWTVFAIFQQVDRVIRVGWVNSPTLSILLIVILTVFAVRVAWRLSISIIGLVTQRFDGGQWLDGQSAVLEPDTVPDLESVVDRVCERINVRRPDQLRLSSDQQCYVMEERHFAWKTKRRVVLAMGLPQLLVMTVGEIQVILAHELAHFRSGDTTLTVFLFRLAETARINAKQLREHKLWFVDPVYWYFALYHQVFQLASAPWRRYHELMADQVSAKAYGGELASHTLLKDWFIESQFESALEEYVKGDVSEQTVYEFFMSRWQAFTPESHDYLERRLSELERPSWFEAQPTIRQRLACMRAFHPMAPVDNRSAIDLFSDAQLMRLERELSAKVIAEFG